MRRLPSLTPEKVMRALERAGFALHTIKGSHHYFKHPHREGYVTVAVHRRDLPRGTLTAIIKQAGLSREEFLQLL